MLLSGCPNLLRFSRFHIFCHHEHIWNINLCDLQGLRCVQTRCRCADGPERFWKFLVRIQLLIDHQRRQINVLELVTHVVQDFADAWESHDPLSAVSTGTFCDRKLESLCLSLQSLISPVLTTTSESVYLQFNWIFDLTNRSQRLYGPYAMASYNRLSICKPPSDVELTA